MYPKISIVMPVYNSSFYLHESIRSILNQTFDDFEFIIIDDGSTDNSLEIVKRYQDKRIKLQTLEHDYIVSLNHGMRLAKGKYIVRMDSDDKMLPERLQKQFNFMETNPEIAVSGCWFQTFGKETNIYQLETTHDAIVCNLLSGNPMCHPSVIMRADVLSSLFYKRGKDIYDKSFIYASDNYEREEVVQEVFIKLWEIRKSLKEENEIDGLLFIITRNLIFNKTRKSMNELKLKETLKLAEEASNEMEQDLEAKDLALYLDKLIDLLPEKQKLTFILNKKKGLSIKEIAVIMNISEKGVARNLYLATKFLKQHFILFIIIWLYLNTKR